MNSDLWGQQAGELGSSCPRWRPARTWHKGTDRRRAGGHHVSRQSPTRADLPQPLPDPEQTAPPAVGARRHPRAPRSPPERPVSEQPTPQLRPPPDSTGTFSPEPQASLAPSLPRAPTLRNQAPQPPPVRGATSPACPGKQPSQPRATRTTLRPPQHPDNPRDHCPQRHSCGEGVARGESTRVGFSLLK